VKNLFLWWHGLPARVFHGRTAHVQSLFEGPQPALATHGQDAHATTRWLLTHAFRLKSAGQNRIFLMNKAFFSVDTAAHDRYNTLRKVWKENKR